MKIIKKEHSLTTDKRQINRSSGFKITDIFYK